MSHTLFSHLPASTGETVRLAEGAVLLRAFASEKAGTLVGSLRGVVSVAPFRHMVTPGGFRMSVAMTNCGEFGWISDESGYRYDAVDPMTNHLWPAIPDSFLRIAADAAATAGFAEFCPDACLINRYEPGARLTMHQDKNERDLDAPIVSVSLGLPAVFLFGGLSRKDRPRRLLLESGDVAVWGGPARLAYHGIAPLPAGDHPLTGPFRFNLTFRKVF